MVDQAEREILAIMLDHPHGISREDLMFICGLSCARASVGVAFWNLVGDGFLVYEDLVFVNLN